MQEENDKIAITPELYNLIMGLPTQPVRARNSQSARALCKLKYGVGKRTHAQMNQGILQLNANGAAAVQDGGPGTLQAAFRQRKRNRR